MVTFVLFILVVLILYVVLGGAMFLGIGMAAGSAVRDAIKRRRKGRYE